MSTIFQVLLVGALVRMRVTPLLANAIAFAISAQLNFTLSAFFTWRHRQVAGTLRHRWVRFNAVAAGALLLNSAAFWLLHSGGLTPVAAAAGAVVVSSGASYLLSRLMVFTSGARTLAAGAPLEPVAGTYLRQGTLRKSPVELLPPLHDASTVATKTQVAVITVAVLLPLALLPFLGARVVVMGVVALVTLLYLADLGFYAYVVTGAAFRRRRIARAEEPEHDWPVYTVLCPIYREAAVLPQFLGAMTALDYPVDRLQIILLLEEDDVETRSAAANLHLPPHFEVLVLPDTLPKTKPKACNAGLMKARGEFTVIFDTEDVPEPDQLKKAVRRFRASQGDVACLQAPLNFYNPRQNVLTRLFTAEYSLWFDLMLEGLQEMRGPIPLGGTSNHFRTEVLVGLGGWDPHNVTEDCDLGIRLYKQGFRTGMLRSTTYEEANPDLRNWVRQRSRWIKGYMQTFLVHTRGGWRAGDPHLATFVLTVGGKVAVNFINPVMWAVTLLYFIARPVVGATIESVYPAPVFYAALISLLVGNGLFIYTFLLGSAQRGNWDLVKYGFFAPLYWLAMSVAACRAAWQLITKPFYWEKTRHGLHITEGESVTVRAVAVDEWAA